MLDSEAPYPELVTSHQSGSASYADSIQALKDVLGAINNVKQQGPHMNILYSNLLDRFRTRLLACNSSTWEQYNDDYQKCSQLQSQWDALEAEAIQVNATLEEVKQDFSAITSQQVTDFTEKVARFYEFFITAGPGRGNIELSAKLFALDITAYPELSKVSSCHACKCS